MELKCSEKRHIDLELCTGCGECADDCISKNIIIIDKKAHFRERGVCINCGHCNAICPQGAIAGGNLLETCCEGDSLLSIMTMKRTVREYNANARISGDVLDKIILAGQSAPTARNRKSARICIVKEKLEEIYQSALAYLVSEVQKKGSINPMYNTVLEMAEVKDRILWGAEYLVVFVGKKENLLDAAMSAERMQLEAAALGVSSAYRGDMIMALNNVPDIREKMGIRKYEEVLVAFAMGISDRKFFRPAVKCNRQVEWI